MAAASYISDLASTATSTANGTIFYCATAADPTTGSLGTLAFGEPTGSIAGATPGFETDYFIKGVATMAKSFNATGVGGFGTSTTNAASVPTDGAVFYWFMFTAPNAIGTKANGGMQMIMGSTSANYYRYYTGGSDTYTYGGWQCFPISPTITSGTGVVAQGTPGAAKQYFGVASNVVNAVARGNPLACGGVTFGRGYIDSTAGDLANGYATFAGIATYNDANTAGNYRRLGIFQAVDGGYKYQGLLRLGTTATAVDFRDSNKVITINNTEFVTAAFNTIEVNNAGSRVDWTGISISALGTVSKGRFVVNAAADVNILGCTFTDMDTFTLNTGTTIDDSTFRRCGLVTTGSAVLTNCIFDKSTSSASALTSSLALLDSCSFISDGSNHAVELNSLGSGTMTWNGTLSGYVAGVTGSPVTPTSTGNEAIFVNVGSGSITISVADGASVPSIRSAGATVNVTAGQVTLQLTGLITGSDIVILTAGTTTELANINANSGSTYNYVYTYAAGTKVDVCVYKSGYVPFITRYYELGSANASLPVKQVLDRNYVP